MKVVILGASGGCGRQLLRLATQGGHEVTAVVRPNSQVDGAEGVRVLRGDLTDVAFLRDAVRGADVVMSALGLRLPGLAPWHRPEVPDFLSRSTPALIEAMKSEGVKRLMVISAGGVGDSRAQMPGVFKAFIDWTALRHAYAELARMEALLLESGLEVCVCRPTGLNDGPATGKVVVATGPLRGRAAISREDVATWMLAQAAQPTFSARTPLITVTGV